MWSVSYGEGVNGGNGGVIQPATAHQLNFQLQKFALRGMSVLVASGDSGVYNRLPFEKYVILLACASMVALDLVIGKRCTVQP